MPRAAASLAPASVPVNSARAASASASASAAGAAAAAPSPAVPVSGGRARGAAARGAKRLARKVAQGTVLAAGLVALQLGAFDSDPRERLFDIHMVDRLESPLTHFRD